MARKEIVNVNGVDYTLQSVSPTWYFQQNDRYGMSGDGRRDTRGYIDVMIKNTVIAPTEVAAAGISYFDRCDDIETPELLVRQIEMFLRPGKQSGISAALCYTE